MTVRLRREIRIQQSDHTEDGNDPAGCAILARTGTQISDAQERRAGECTPHERQSNQGDVSKEGSKSTTGANGERDRRESSRQ